MCGNFFGSNISFFIGIRSLNCRTYLDFNTQKSLDAANAIDTTNSVNTNWLCRDVRTTLDILKLWRFNPGSNSFFCIKMLMFKFPTDGLVYIVKAVKKRKPGNKVWYKINLLDFVFRYNRLWIFNLQKTTGIVNYCIYLSETDIC